MDIGKHFLQGLAWVSLVVVMVVSWQFISLFYYKLIPTPMDVYLFIISLPPNLILSSIFRTLYNSVMGFLLAFLSTLVSILLAYLNKFLKLFFTALNTFIQSVSVLVWALIFVMVFGVLNPISPILVTAAATYPLLLSSMFSAVEVLDKKLKELSTFLGASKFQEFTSIILPGGVLYMAGASRAAIGLALRISVVAEAFGGGGGIGYQLIYNYDIGISSGVFAWAIMLVSIMIILDYLILRPVERWTRKWLI